jgi:chemotaxis protein MotB
MKKLLPLSIIITLFAFACVPARKFEEAKKKKEACETENATLKSDFRDIENKYNEQVNELESIKRKIKALETDTTLLGMNFRNLTRTYNEVNNSYELLKKLNKELLDGNQVETQKLSGQLQYTQEKLQMKEDALKKLELELLAKKENLEKLNAELKVREEKVNELQRVLKEKDMAVDALRQKVANALVGFENQGLTIRKEKGKVYVSLDEKLLFASGSIKVEQNGVKALKELSKVLEQNEDINVMIEGHTDDVPMSGTGLIKDNWDLSVMRATSVLKIMLDGSRINPTRLTAAGRGEFLPLNPDKTKEARAQNRRTEIILTPKLDELFEILE